MRSFFTAIALALTLVTTGALADEPAYMPLRAVVILPGGWKATGPTDYEGPNAAHTPVANAILHVKGQVAVLNRLEDDGESAGHYLMLRELSNAIDHGSNLYVSEENGEGESNCFAMDYKGKRHVVLFVDVAGHPDTVAVIVVVGSRAMDTMKVKAALQRLAANVIVP